MKLTPYYSGPGSGFFQKTDFPTKGVCTDGKKARPKRQKRPKGQDSHGPRHRERCATSPAMHSRGRRGILTDTPECDLANLLGAGSQPPGFKGAGGTRKAVWQDAAEIAIAGELNHRPEDDKPA